MEKEHAIKKLIGPHIIAFFENIDGRRILLLGEYHLKLNNNDILDKQSIFVHNWLADVISKSSKCIDLMVEQEYLFYDDYIGDIPGESSMGYVIKKFYDCYSKNKQKCRKLYPNLRYHYIDLRNEVIWLLVKYIDEDLRFIKELSNTNYINKVLRVSFEYLVGENVDLIIVNDFIEKLHKYNNKIFKKEGDTLKKLKIDTKDAFDEYRDLICKSLSKCPFIYKKIKIIISAFIEAYTSTKIDPLISLVCIPMDLYCIIRMFQNYDINKLQNGPPKCIDSIYGINRNIILFTGAVHTMNYMTVLKLIGYTPNFVDYDFNIDKMGQVKLHDMVNFL